MLKRLLCAAFVLLPLAACNEDTGPISLGEVSSASFEEITGAPWPLTVEGGELFCQYREVSLGDNFLLWIHADGEDYALNTTAWFLLNDGDAKNWEDIWKRRPDGERYISIEPFQTYVPEACRTA
ncbi:MAG: hypothetical protein AAGK37_08790 [Pseudomonadota bacterium]